MKLNLKRPLLFFDIESTGLNIATDCIAELSFLKVFPDKDEPELKTWRFCPWDYALGRQHPIDPSASEVNGLKDEDLAAEPKLIQKIDEVVSWLKGSDLAGYNSAKFDLPLLVEEIERIKLYCRSRMADPAVPSDKKSRAKRVLDSLDFDLHDCKMVDVQSIYHIMEPRNLKAAHRFYCGGDFDNAHSAEADTVATYEVLLGELQMYKEPDELHPQALENNVDALSKIGNRPKMVDFAGRLIKADNGEILINFGKHKGKSAREVYESDPSYYDWIAKGEFTLDTKAQFEKLKNTFAIEKLKSKYE